MTAAVQGIYRECLQGWQAVPVSKQMPYLPDNPFTGVSSVVPHLTFKRVRGSGGYKTPEEHADFIYFKEVKEVNKKKEYYEGY